MLDSAKLLENELLIRSLCNSIVKFPAEFVVMVRLCEHKSALGWRPEKKCKEFRQGSPQALWGICFVSQC